MAELMAIADEYATADAGMTNPIRVDEAGRVVSDSPATCKGRAEAQEGGKSNRRDSDATGKRKATDAPVESKVVATTEGRPAGGFDSRRMAVFHMVMSYHVTLVQRCACCHRACQ